MNQRNTIRRRVREARLAISDVERECCALELAGIVTAHPLFKRSRHLAAYFAVNGEIDPRPIVKAAHAMGKTVYMPVLTPCGANRLWFTSWRPGERLVRNRFGIPEPDRAARHRIPLQKLDLVLTPLVAFDQHGNRIGLGGGFYDRSFAYLRKRKIWRRPRLFGLAYEFQREKRLESAPWDVPLDAIATDQHLYLAKR